MPETNQFDQEMQQYFSSLPIFVQETIKQSGPKLTCKAELVQCAENMMHSGCQNGQCN